MTSIPNFIRYTYYALFFFLPFIMTPLNYELFEFNKMLFVYAISIIVSTLWAIRIVAEKRVIFSRTPLDIPILLFVFSHIISTINSIDPYISIWGYYGRFNGGMISLVSYLVLYYGFVSTINDYRLQNTDSRNQTNKKSHDQNDDPAIQQSKYSIIINCVLFSLVSGVFVSIYGILQRFGIDAHLWVQDVQNRIFSTLGQPNWLAAFLVVLLPIALSFFINSQLSISKEKQKNVKQTIRNYLKFDNWYLPFGILTVVFYITLLFTKSRSGFLAFWIVNIIFWTGSYALIKKYKPKLVSSQKRQSFFLKTAIGINAVFLLITISIGSPYSQITNLISSFQNDHTVSEQKTSEETTSNQPDTAQPIETSITDSGDIRKLVWQGAIDAAVSRPYFGWGVDTFAWVYYQFRPVEHNLTSEWDFLYNKAHNEYLNYAATIGFVGLGSYLLIIGTFIIWVLRNFQITISKFKTNTKSHLVNPIKKEHEQLKIDRLRLFDNWDLGIGILTIGLFCGWISLLITNFFGFSVVVTAVYFWMIPALIFSMRKSDNNEVIKPSSLSLSQQIGISIVAGIGIYLLVSIASYWQADYAYAQSQSHIASGEYIQAYQKIQNALFLRPYDAVYINQTTGALAPLAVVQYEQEENQEGLDELASSSDLAKRAIQASDTALQLSPGNVSFWKSRTRMFYTLSQIDDSYAEDALSAILKAESLAPNDPQIVYNAGIVYELNDQTNKAIEKFKRAIELKPNYKDAAWALVIFYETDNNEQEAQKWLRYILDTIDPNDEEVKRRLNT